MAKLGMVAMAVLLLMGNVGCASPVPEGFHEYVVFDRLDLPTALAFAPDGRIFVAEKRGVVKVFADALDDSPQVVADLRTNVFGGWDRGLLDLALPPDFTTDPAIYLAYTYDAAPGGVAPRWGQPGEDVDVCPTPPGPTTNGCVVTGRVARLPLDPAGAWTGEEQVLVHDWCQQFPSHSVGTLAFGPDGALYVSGGDGASYTFDDYGQAGDPPNPCGDPPLEGGSLRSQDIRSSGDPVGLSGTIIRIDPATGAAMPGNPLGSDPDPNARRIVAYGLRNPFRFTFRPGTNELWIGDVGSYVREEINRSIGNDAVVDNFGWPCYEGPGILPNFDADDLPLCESLYAAGPNAVTPPWWSYNRVDRLTPNEDCDPGNGSAVSGLAFAPASSAYPDSYDDALFFGDAARGCIWVMPAGDDGLPDPAAVTPFVEPAGTPVELTFSPSGELWYIDHYGGSIRRIGYSASNRPPTAAVQATPSSGDPPLTVTFDAGGSSDVDPGDTLSFAWDLDDDGAFDDGSGPTITKTFSSEGIAVVGVRVSDQAGASASATVGVVVGNPQDPRAVVELPVAGTAAAVGDTAELSGYGLDADGNVLGPGAVRWRVDLLHCPFGCHRHSGVFALNQQLQGSFAVPDHEQPAAMEVFLTVTWNGRTATTVRRIDYATTPVTLASEPAGVTLTSGSVTAPSPFTRAYATNGRVSISAPATATIDGTNHAFVGWSDGGARSHEITVPADPTTLTATYAPAP